jgi:DNA-binding response OmpR family regulator
LLLVEDDPIHAEATATLLTRYYRVDQARSGTAALAEWRAKRHDVILLDLMLPEVSGEEVQRQVLSERHDQIIVILTANSDSDKHPAMVFSGASAFLRKPVDLVSVMQTIESILRARECEALADIARSSEDQLNHLSARVHAANYSLVRGQTGIAARHLQSALSGSIVPPTDDEWAALLVEFDQSSRR